MRPPVRLVVGLGNPGRAYQRTHHNLGFMVLDHHVQHLGLRFQKTRDRAEVAEAGGVHFLKPLTFMNLSGEAVGPFCHDHRISVDELVVVCDDLDLPPRALRIRPGGGSGGHKGLKSLIHTLGTDQFARLRVGIGHPTEPGMGAIDWVLARLPKDQDWDGAVAAASQALAVILDEGVEAAMNRFNGVAPA